MCKYAVCGGGHDHGSLLSSTETNCVPRQAALVISHIRNRADEAHGARLELCLCVPGVDHHHFPEMTHVFIAGTIRWSMP